MNDTIEILKRLSMPLPDEAIQRTKKEDTKKKYDTDGYSYQYCVDRFNEVLGTNWGYNFSVIKELNGTFKSGQPYFDITVDMNIWVIDKNTPRNCVGGHTSSNYSDALKGAITNAFKKTAAFWGVGRDAYAGTIDDDNKPSPDRDENRLPTKTNEAINKPGIYTEISKSISSSKTIDELNEIKKDIIDKNKNKWLTSKEFQGLMSNLNIKIKQIGG